MPTKVWRQAPRFLSAAILVAVSVLTGIVATACASDRQPQTVEFVVPAGTAQRLADGETVAIMPARLELRVGDTLLIRNEDVVSQSVGPYVVPAQDEVRFTYGAPGRFEGYCPLSEGERYEIVVEG